MMMKKWVALFTAILCLSLSGPVFAESAVTRIKDIAKVQGVRSNQLVGYGLVMGLDGTGDSNKTLEVLQSVANMLRKFGVTIDQASLKTKNVAAVVVTATLPPFVREGDTIDVTVSSMGDAKSIQGGTLIQTPLQAGNGEVYAVTADGFAHSPGRLGFQELLRKDVMADWMQGDLSVLSATPADLNGDGQLECFLAVSDGGSERRIILSEQDGVVYAYLMNYTDGYTLDANGDIVCNSPYYSYRYRLIFDGAQAFLLNLPDPPAAAA